MNLPFLTIEADSIPQAHYMALSLVHEKGASIRTQYDRNDGSGFYIDPPSKDARVSIIINNPFMQPRFSRLSYCQIGKYIAEFVGAKDHLVVPAEDLKLAIKANKGFAPTQWPYCYHQRLTAYPTSDGGTIDQLANAVEKLAHDTYSRRAVAITSYPEIDSYMKQDIPCLREIQFRAIDEGHKIVVHVHATWRSRDLYKAWADNVIGLTNLVQIEVITPLMDKIHKRVEFGTYSETSGSLHIYGQDYTEKGMNNFFKVNPDLDTFVKASQTSEEVLESRILPDLEELKTEATWNFGRNQIGIIYRLIEGYKRKVWVP